MNSRILIFNGSPRKAGNTAGMLKAFIEGAESRGHSPEVIRAADANITPCRGCLRCNGFKRCVIKGDDWSEMSKKILEAETLVFAAPVYFHHMPGPLKIILDRFRSFVHVQITESGLIHTPWEEWNKRIVLLTCLGSSSPEDARPLNDLFKSISEMLGPGNSLTELTAVRLAVSGQIGMSEEELTALYPKLKLTPNLAAGDSVRNREVLNTIRRMGEEAASRVN